MKMHDWNTDKPRVVLLVHPMLSSAADMKRFIADNLGNEYRYLVPDLSAHGDDVGNPYKSAPDEAEAIHAYLVEHGVAHLDLAYGASLGGVVLLQLMKYGDVSAGQAFFEGTSFFSGSKFLCRMIRSKMLKKHERAVRDPELCERKMADMFGAAAAPALAKHFIALDEESIVNIVYDCGYVEFPPLSDDMQQRCTFAYGSKDFDCERAMKTIPKVYPHAKTQVWKGFGHCEKLTSDPAAYASMLSSLMQG